MIDLRLNNHWVSGFTSAEGCLIIYDLSGKCFGLKLSNTQHSIEEQLISLLAYFFSFSPSVFTFYFYESKN